MSFVLAAARNADSLATGTLGFPRRWQGGGSMRPDAVRYRGWGHISWREIMVQVVCCAGRLLSRFARERVGFCPEPAQGFWELNRLAARKTEVL